MGLICSIVYFKFQIKRTIDDQNTLKKNLDYYIDISLYMNLLFVQLYIFFRHTFHIILWNTLF